MKSLNHNKQNIIIIIKTNKKHHLITTIKNKTNKNLKVEKAIVNKTKKNDRTDTIILNKSTFSGCLITTCGNKLVVQASPIIVGAIELFLF